jgi:hypothetical protein
LSSEENAGVEPDKATTVSFQIICYRSLIILLFDAIQSTLERRNQPNFMTGIVALPARVTVETAIYSQISFHKVKIETCVIYDN